MPYRRAQTKFWFDASALSLIASVEITSAAMVTLALPAIARTFQVSDYQVSLALVSYYAASAVALLWSDWISAFFGGGRTLLGTVLVFSVASLLCGVAPNLTSFILCNIVQGLAGSTLAPLAQSQVIGSAEPNQRGLVLALYSLGAVAGPAVGLLVSGDLIMHLGWRWIFYFDAVVGLIWCVVYWRVIAPMLPRWIQANTLIDFGGVGLFALALTSTIWGISTTPSFLGFAAIAAGVIMFFLFLIRTARSRLPLLALPLFKQRTFNVGLFMTACMGFSFLGVTVLLSLFFQGPLAYPSTQAGLFLAERFIGTLLALPLVGFLANRMDSRKILLIGFAACSATLFIITYFHRPSSNDVFWSLILLGFFSGLIFVPMVSQTYKGIAATEVLGAAPLVNIARNIGGALGLLLLMSFVSHRHQTAESFREAFRICACLMLLCIPLLLVFRPGVAKDEKVAVETASADLS